MEYPNATSAHAELAGEVSRSRKLRVKYAIIGAGQTGLQFLRHALENGSGPVAIVERAGQYGGHWVDQYGFVKLHASKLAYWIHAQTVGLGLR